MKSLHFFTYEKTKAFDIFRDFLAVLARHCNNSVHFRDVISGLLWIFSWHLLLVLICHLMSEIPTLTPFIYLELTFMASTFGSVMIHK